MLLNPWLRDILFLIFPILMPESLLSKIKYSTYLALQGIMAGDIPSTLFIRRNPLEKLKYRPGMALINMRTSRAKSLRELPYFYNSYIAYDSD